MFSRFGISLLLATFCLLHSLYAQSPGCISNESQAAEKAQETKITIVGIEFQGESQLPEALRSQLSKDVEQMHLHVTPENSDQDWIGQVINSIMNTLQSQGYFKALVDGTPFLVRAEPKERFYVLRVEVNSGRQYQVGEIRIENATLFSSTELRSQFPLQQGDLFDVIKIRQGMESMTKLYSSKGYIDFVPEPELTIHEDPKGPIDILMKMDEGVQYRVRAVDTLGLGKRAEDLLKSQLQPGDVFDSVSFSRFLKENADVFPNEDDSARTHTQIRRDPKNGTVDIVMDFRCPAKA